MQGRVLVKGNALYDMWKQAWVQLREPDEWRPVLEIYLGDNEVYLSLNDCVMVLTCVVRRVNQKS
jgi:hypothetical protein